MPGLCSSVGTGYSPSATGEGHIYCWTRLYKPDSTRRGIIQLRGAGGTHLSAYPPAEADRALIDLGHPAISADLGGVPNPTWGNDTGRTRTQEAWDFLVAKLAVKTDKVILIAGSMGFLSACAYARLNPTKVACIAASIPAIDVQDIHDNNRGGNATSIETAYGGLAGYNAAMPAKNPFANAAELAGIPMKLWYSTNDDITMASKVTEFAAATGAETVSLGAQGHSAAGVNVAQVAEFVLRHV